MRLDHPKSARKVAAPCRQCGQEFWFGKRHGRKRLFCSNSCRQAYFRNAKIEARYQTKGALRNAENSPTSSVACKGKNRGRAFPIDLVGGGFRWPGAEALDPELRRRILDVELGAGRGRQMPPRAGDGGQP
jgi:hypothetical protein